MIHDSEEQTFGALSVAPQVDMLALAGVVMLQRASTPTEPWSAREMIACRQTVRVLGHTQCCIVWSGSQVQTMPPTADPV